MSSLRRGRGFPPETSYILGLFLFSRVALTLIGVASRAMLGDRGSASPVTYSVIPWLDIWGMWDSEHYVALAARGYPPALTPELVDVRYAFFPLYPLLARIASDLLTRDAFVGGLVVSNVALLIGSFCLYRLARLDYDEPTARRAVKYLYAFPTAFLLSGMLTESLFLCLALLSFYWARRGNWPNAGAAGLLAVLTRLPGVLLIVPLAWEWLAGRRDPSPQPPPLNGEGETGTPASILPLPLQGRGLGGGVRSLLWLALIPAGLLLYALFNLRQTGSLTTFLQVQSRWERRFTHPLDALIEGLQSQEAYRVFETVVAVLAVILLALLIRRVRFSYLLYAAMSVFLPLMSSSQSMARYILVVFPFFLLFASFGKDETVDGVLTLCLVLLQGFLVVFWMTGFQYVY